MERKENKELNIYKKSTNGNKKKQQKVEGKKEDKEGNIKRIKKGIRGDKDKGKGGQ